MAALGLFFVILGAGQWVNGAEWGKFSLFGGLALWLFVLFQWFSDAISESLGGQYGHKIDISFRWSMTWFIFSEVMFLRRLLHRVVVGPHALGSCAGQPGECGSVARIQSRLAQPGCGCDCIACQHCGTLHDDGSMAAAPPSTPALLLSSGVDADHCPPRAAGKQCVQDHQVHVGHCVAGSDLPVRARL